MQDKLSTPVQPTGVKPALFEQFARIGRAMSHGQRLELLELLAQAESPVDALARTMMLPIANVSQHLQQLKQAGLVQARREGRSIIYRLASARVVDLLTQMQAVADETLGEVDALVQDCLAPQDALQPVPLAEVMQRAQDGLVTIIDVRPPHEFAAAHLPGAINLPLGELAQRLGELPTGREVVAYCRGRYCVLSFEAVARLRAAGYEARRIEDGIPRWIADAQPLEGAQTRYGVETLP
jgi:rhodanese-related sulfurtransferase/DNA-binding transcriptional ArsR family regulator